MKLTDSQLLFNIEALKIAKRARDLQNTAHLGRTRKKIKQNFLLNKLRKFRSLPNLSQIKNIAMRRIKSRTGKETQKYLDINRYLDIFLDFSVSVLCVYVSVYFYACKNMLNWPVDSYT